MATESHYDWTQVLLEETSWQGSMTDYEEVSFEASRKDFLGYLNVAHGMLYAKDPGVLWENLFDCVKHAAIMMQMRFDGLLGFPGGGVDKGPDELPVDGLNRELKEEINLDLKRFAFSQDKHHIMTHVHRKKKAVLHFYAQEVSLADVVDIEKAQFQAEEWGKETYGMIRVPLYTVQDRGHGFPAFLANGFAGNAKLQLVHTLQALSIVPRQELDHLMGIYVNLRQNGLRTAVSTDNNIDK